MPPRTNDFQQLVHLIESQLSPHDATVTESKEFIDHVTGVKREVDITIERKSGIHNFVIGIECIDHKRPADAPWIEKIASKYEDIDVDKTIVVSRSGFYRPALAKAEKRKIEVLTLRQAEESDWVTYTSRLTALKHMFTQTETTEIHQGIIQVLPPSTPPYPPPPLFEGLDTDIYDSEGKKLTRVQQVIDSVIPTDANFRTLIENIINQHNRDPGKDKEGSVEIPFQFVVQALDESYFVLDKTGKKHRLAQIVLLGKCLLRTTKVPLTRTNYGPSSVLHGAAEFLGNPTQLAWIEDEDGNLKFGASVRRLKQ
jgi:hypothetical protein